MRMQVDRWSITLMVVVVGGGSLVIPYTHTESDMSVAAHHMYLAAVAVAALSLVFTLSLTDQQTLNPALSS